MNSILVSDKYRVEIENLVNDPILINMANSIPKEIKVLDNWEWMQKINREYSRRGGNRNISIGGPTKAIIQLRGV